MKMNLSALKYIALEGGGGKGAVYKGAIIALEKLFERSWNKGECLKIADGELTQREAANPVKPPGTTDVLEGTSILDYYDQDKELRIKGIAGSSAGAITAFILALGLTSDNLDTIFTSFPFKEELLPNHQLHEGKYRMVGMDQEGKARILVGEDHFQKLGEENVAPYVIPLFGGDKIGSNGLKSGMRSFIVAQVFSVIFTGLKEQWRPISKLVKVVADYLQKVNVLKQASAWLKSNVVQTIYAQLFQNEALVRLATSATPVPLNAALKGILRLSWLNINRLPWGSKNQMKFKGVLPVDNVVAAVANIIWDRGIYGGFEIREFFFKVLVMAISEDTHFSRRLQERSEFLKTSGLTEAEIKSFTCTFNDRFEIKADGTSRATLVKLGQLQEKLTFKEFYDTTKVNLSICVTNSSTNQPIYFSHYFAPDFPVLEALGASISYPVAFKPVYNEANALLNSETKDNSEGTTTETRTFLTPSDYVKFKRHGKGTPIYKEVFSMREYNKHLGHVLAYIKDTSPLGISVNGNLSFRSFLPYLRAIIENNSFKSYMVKDHENNSFVTYDSNYMKALCYFYYNSAFKGLLLDGGVTNPLPASIFTLQTEPKESVQNLEIKKQTLSLKVDSSFPEAIRTAAFDILDRDNKTLDRVLNWADEDAHYNLARRLLKGRSLLKALKKDKGLPNLSRPVWIKISRELVAEYRNTLGGFTPWNKEVNIVMGLLNSVQFGLDQGQIESIDDNENIIPLYCYGLGTFDFDLTSAEAQPLVEMAVEAGRVQVEEYFGDGPTK